VGLVLPCELEASPDEVPPGLWARGGLISPRRLASIRSDVRDSEGRETAPPSCVRVQDFEGECGLSPSWRALGVEVVCIADFNKEQNLRSTEGRRREDSQQEGNSDLESYRERERAGQHSVTLLLSLGFLSEVPPAGKDCQRSALNALNTRCEAKIRWTLNRHDEYLVLKLLETRLAAVQGRVRAE
jgi:hypothetical protein